MHHCLPGRLANIEPDVVPRRRELCLDQALTSINQRDQSHSLYLSHREKIRRMPERNHEQVALADRVTIPAGIAQLITGDYVFSNRITERAFHIYSMADTFVPQSYTCIFRLNSQTPGPASDPDHNFLQLVQIGFAG
jgi:hypothetical protein